MWQRQCHWPIYPFLLPSPVLALYFMVELYLHAMVPHAEPAQLRPDQCVPVGRAKMLFRARGNSCTWNWQRWRGHRCERWPGLIICRCFLSWPLLLSSSYCSCAACVAPSAALLACLACLVCLPVCLSVRLYVCLSGRLHFTAVKQLNLSRKLDKVRLEWR